MQAIKLAANALYGFLGAQVSYKRSNQGAFLCDHYIIRHKFL